MDEERIRKLVRELIAEIGEDPTREGLTKTPERVADAYKEIFGSGVSEAELSINLILYFLFFPIDTCNILSSDILISIDSLFSARLISLENSSMRTPNFMSLSQLYFSNAELGQEISISATCDGSIPLNEMPSTVASKVASSTNVDIAEIIAFHSSEVFVLAENSNLIK